MREIKFRAWDTSLGSMFYQEGCTLREIIEASNECVDEWWFDEKEDILMQYTGLHDKNGKEIYEGDIVKWKVVRTYGAMNTRCTEIGSVEYRDAAFFAVGNGILWDLIIISEKEVIGNIHENPELLEKSATPPKPPK
jgi:uncharacterized phage protein (TIGR01671 family)